MLMSDCPQLQFNGLQSSNRGLSVCPNLYLPRIGRRCPRFSIVFLASEFGDIDFFGMACARQWLRINQQSENKLFSSTT